MQPPDLEAVNRALSATVQKQEAELKAMRAHLREAARLLEAAGWQRSAQKMRDAAA